MKNVVWKSQTSLKVWTNIQNVWCWTGRGKISTRYFLFLLVFTQHFVDNSLTFSNIWMHFSSHSNVNKFEFQLSNIKVKYSGSQGKKETRSIGTSSCWVDVLKLPLTRTPPPRPAPAQSTTTPSPSSTPPHAHTEFSFHRE